MYILLKFTFRQGGYKKLEEAKIQEKITEAVSNSEVHEVSKHVVQHGLTVLEAIGSVIGNKAANAFAESSVRKNSKVLKIK